MPKIISIHEYVLRTAVDEKQFENVLREAQESDLLQMPGLLEFYFVKGIKGLRRGYYAAVWIYESREAWEKLWGPLEQPRQKQDYPKNWMMWEERILAPFLATAPDRINYTAYETL